MPDTIEKDRYKNRRAMAWRAFYIVWIQGALVGIYAGWSTENAQIVATMQAFIFAYFGMFISIVLTYFGVTTVTDYKEISMQSPKPPEDWGGS